MGSPRRLGRDERQARRAQSVGAVGILLATAIPLILWHAVIASIVNQFRLDLRYILGVLSPWMLMTAGLLLFLPVALSAGRKPDSRLYPRSRNALLAWATTFYLLGFGLASQVALIWNNGVRG